MLAAVAFAGGILIVAFAVIGSGLQWAASYQGEFIEMDPGVVRVLWEGGAIAFVATAGIGFVALVGATSAVALATGALPRLLGAAGAVEAIFCIQAIDTGWIPPTINLDRIDPECALNHVANKARKAPTRVAISNSCGFGGTNAALVFGAPS